jgi:hypothetical protein
MFLTAVGRGRSCRRTRSRLRWLIFMDDHPAGNRPGVLEVGCGQGKQATGLARSPVAITAVRHSAGKAGARALVPDAPGAA